MGKLGKKAQQILHFFFFWKNKASMNFLSPHDYFLFSLVRAQFFKLERI